MTCKHPNCDRQAVALGWCRGHWEALPQTNDKEDDEAE